MKNNKQFNKQPNNLNKIKNKKKKQNKNTDNPKNK